ncbi:pentatricopeptide repeat-containing protein At3g12770-like [Nymphaea colorata]|uniref:pentatricopeptide repeat-containing protein At3g12770-like n=1 Tax=Nymphaea colorata TaxID=210225 RepID=UPI00129E8973|nr:pentatricopeptide repeat-containing protein At3g12770-like [Nymphaea colorata]
MASLLLRPLLVANPPCLISLFLSNLFSRLPTFRFCFRACSSLPLFLDNHEGDHPNPVRGPTDFTICTSLLDDCANLRDLTQAQSWILKLGLQQSNFITTKFVHVCCEFGEIRHACDVFDEMSERNVFLWNAIIRGHSRSDLLEGALGLYCRMQSEGVLPDGFTFPHVLKACSGLGNARKGREIHAQIFRLGFESDVFVQNGLITMYSKCGWVDHARSLFDKLQDRTIVSWTSIISGYAQNGHPVEALQIFRKMQCSKMEPDCIALVSILRAYTDVEGLQQGKSIHGYVIKGGFESEVDILISLTAMYAKCGEVETARSLFDRVTSPGIILWNAMISGYAKNGYASEAVELFRELLPLQVRPDSVTVRAAILACAQVGSVELCRWIGDYVRGSEHRADIFVNTALIDMYAKCGSIAEARRVFDMVPVKDVVVWTAMIMGYGLHGHGQDALALYEEMKRAGMKPNDVTFVGILSACNHSGLVDEGWRYFHSMKRGYGIEPRHQHYACVVDLLGRGGYLDEAYEFIKKMPMEPAVTVWGALLSACKIYGHVELGQYAAERVFAVDPTNAGHYVQLSNLYAAAGRWGDVAKVRVLMKERGLVKALGYSLIEINGKLQAFRVGDDSHPRSKEIFAMLEKLESKLKEAGYVPHVDSVLHDLDNEEKEEMLCNHSEMIAIAFGLISTAPGTTLRITKNLRACINCHSATKLISRIEDREIIVRDANRFHHFKDGSCSCGDYW